jgi:LysR family transcriptional regulator, benzoate and cis,cis-muconate-responsive activator of ben and cat genes
MCNLVLVQLRHLESFLAVVEEGQFAAAARRLFLSPPAVTAHVHALERELSTRLLERHPVTLTPAGERFLPHAFTMVTAAGAASNVVEECGRSKDAPLRVGVAVPGSGELTPAILRAYCDATPENTVMIKGLNCTEYVSSLVERQVDVAFVRPAFQDERVRSDVLTIEPRVVIANAESEIAGADHLRLADILDLRFMGLPDNTPREFANYQHLVEERNGMAPESALDKPLTAQDLVISVAAGRGIGTSLLSLQRYYPWPGVRFIPIIDAPWEPTVLLTRRDDLRPEVQGFRALANILARDLGPKLTSFSGLPAPPGSALDV